MKKRIVIISVFLSLLFTTSVSAASWSTYFGANKGWSAGMKAHIVRNQPSRWTVKVKSIGKGGCWGGQVYQKGHSIKKGKIYRISFTLKSTKFSKWIFVQIPKKNNNKKSVWAKWINCKKGKTVKVVATFKAKYKANAIYFGIGGDFGAKRKYKGDTNAKYRYKIAPNKKLDSRLGYKYARGHSTKIKLKKYSFECLSKSKPKKRIKKIVIYYY